MVQHVHQFAIRCSTSVSSPKILCCSQSVIQLKLLVFVCYSYLRKSSCLPINFVPKIQFCVCLSIAIFSILSRTNGKNDIIEQNEIGQINGYVFSFVASEFIGFGSMDLAQIHLIHIFSFSLDFGFSSRSGTAKRKEKKMQKFDSHKAPELAYKIR